LGLRGFLRCIRQGASALALCVAGESFFIWVRIALSLKSELEPNGVGCWA
jgi:hypothetical protein